MESTIQFKTPCAYGEPTTITSGQSATITLPVDTGNKCFFVFAHRGNKASGIASWLISQESTSQITSNPSISLSNSSGVITVTNNVNTAIYVNVIALT